MVFFHRITEDDGSFAFFCLVAIVESRELGVGRVQIFRVNIHLHSFTRSPTSLSFSIDVETVGSCVFFCRHKNYQANHTLLLQRHFCVSLVYFPAFGMISCSGLGHKLLKKHTPLRRKTRCNALEKEAVYICTGGNHW